MPSSVEIFSVTKFLPGEQMNILASLIFTRVPRDVLPACALPEFLALSRNTYHRASKGYHELGPYAAAGNVFERCGGSIPFIAGHLLQMEESKSLLESASYSRYPAQSEF